MKTKLFALGIFAVLLILPSSATMELGGQAGKEVLVGLGGGTGLWHWGETPLGHIIKDNNLIAGAWVIPEDRSIMQTPLQASGTSGDVGFKDATHVNDIAFDNTFIPVTFGGYLTIPTGYLGNAGHKDAKGVFDYSCFNVPTVYNFPSVY